MSIDWMTALADKLEREADNRPRWASPLDLAQDIDPNVKRTPALNLINDALVKAYNTPDSRLIISVPPQSGKARRPHVDFRSGYSPRTRIPASPSRHMRRVLRDVGAVPFAMTSWPTRSCLESRSMMACPPSTNGSLTGT